MTPTTSEIKRALKRVILVGLIAAFAIINTSCGTMPLDDSVRLRAGAGLGKSHVKGEVEFATTKEHESDVGDVQGVRLEASRQCSIPDLRNLMVGVRVDARTRQARLDDTENGTQDHLDLDAHSVDLMVVGRYYFPVADDFRFYGEVAAGYGYNRGVLELNSEFHGQIKDRDTDYHVVGGAALGAEMDVGSNSSVYLQLDYGIRDLGFEAIDVQSQDFMLYLGGEVRF